MSGHMVRSAQKFCDEPTPPGNLELCPTMVATNRRCRSCFQVNQRDESRRRNGDFVAILQHCTVMPVDPNNYEHRGGGNYGVVVLCPNIVADDRLVYFDHNKDRGSWVIRDFISGQRLDNDHSALTVAQIEAEATYDEFSPWCNVEMNPADWRTYLTLRTTAVSRLRAPLGSVSAVNPQSGSWQPL